MRLIGLLLAITLLAIISNLGLDEEDSHGSHSSSHNSHNGSQGNSEKFVQWSSSSGNLCAEPGQIPVRFLDGTRICVVSGIAELPMYTPTGVCLYHLGQLTWADPSARTGMTVAQFAEMNGAYSPDLGQQPPRPEDNAYSASGMTSGWLRVPQTYCTDVPIRTP